VKTIHHSGIATIWTGDWIVLLRADKSYSYCQ
jgi:hypothetical protein